LKNKPNAKPLKPFIDGLDTYADEYARLVRNSGVKRLLGVYEIPAERFDVSGDGNLRVAGIHHPQVMLTDASIPDDEEPGKDGFAGPEVTATGNTIATRNQHGHVQSAIFICNAPTGLEHILDGPECARTLVLLHELGHADDMAKGLNFDFSTDRLNWIGAEVYAHDYVIRSCLRRGYRLALLGYLNTLNANLHSTSVVVSKAADIALSHYDRDELASRSRLLSETELKRELERTGRISELRGRQSY
jgi:hypothetical protein